MLLIIVLLALKVTGAILLGIIGTTVLSLLVIAFGADASNFFPHLPQGSDIAAVFSGISVNPAQIGADIASVADTAFKLDFGGIFAADKITLTITALIGFVLTDIFDTVGTLIGTGKRTGIFENEDFESGSGIRTRMDKALFADLTATMTGALCGTSNVTTYVESAAGIAEGGRTGFTSMVTAILFLLCLPLVSIVGIIPAVATSPALIVVGVLMMAAIADIDWTDFTAAAVAFVTMAFMPFAYSITTGISVGFIVYVLLKLVTGKIKDVKPIMIIFTCLFILNFILLAIEL
jgi:AGZA family xanthine/uracil permease-like MFS transporter